MTTGKQRSSEIRESTVHSRGLELFVRERGDGYPLLMINGLGGNLEMWGPAEERLSETSRLIMFDAPGTGRSQTPALPLPVPMIASIVWEMVDELGYDRLDVLGYSLGGVIAQQLARAAPGRIRRLALVGTACGWGSMPGTLPAMALMAMPVRYYSRLLYEQTNRLLGEYDAILKDEALADHAAGRLRYPPSLLGYSYQVWAGVLWSSFTWLPEIEVPTLVVSGDVDRLVPPANSVQMAERLANARVCLLPGEGHLLLFHPRSAAHSLLADYFGSEDHERSTAWQAATEVDAETVEHALRSSLGAQPFRAISGAYRWLARDSPLAAFIG